MRGIEATPPPLPGTLPPPPPVPEESERLLAAICHFAPWVGLPVIGPLLLWAVRKESTFIRHHAVQSAAWQGVTLVIFTVVSLFLTFLSFVTCGAGGLLFFGLVPLGLAAAAYDAYHGYLAWRGQRSEFVGLEGIDKRLGVGTGP